MTTFESERIPRVRTVTPRSRPSLPNHLVHARRRRPRVPRVADITARIAGNSRSVSALTKRISPASAVSRKPSRITPSPRWIGLSLAGTAAQYRYCFGDQDIDQEGPVPVALQSGDEIDGPRVERIAPIGLRDNDVGVEDDLSHRRAGQRLRPRCRPAQEHRSACERCPRMPRLVERGHSTRPRIQQLGGRPRKGRRVLERVAPNPGALCGHELDPWKVG